MPIFLKHKILLIHIPKTGGTSIARTLDADYDDKPIMYNESFRRCDKLKGSPQHFTYRDYEMYGCIDKSFRIIAVIRNPHDRFLSEFFWRHRHENISDVSMEKFADSFFNEDNKEFYDGHNLKQVDFLLNSNLEISKNINIIENKNLSDFFKKEYNIVMRKENVTDKPYNSTPYCRSMVNKHWKEDFNLTEYIF